MEFAAIQIVARTCISNPNCSVTGSDVVMRSTHCAAGDRRGLDLYLSTAAATYYDAGFVVSAASNALRRVARP